MLNHSQELVIAMLDPYRRVRIYLEIGKHLCGKGKLSELFDVFKIMKVSRSIDRYRLIKFIDGGNTHFASLFYQK